MKDRIPLKWAMGLGAVIFSISVGAQNPVGNVVTMGFGDIAAIKQRAETGDATAQVALGDALGSQFRATEALEWYRRAAAQGNVEAKYRVGGMLLFGAFGNPSNLGVQPNRTEGLRWTFMAATNLHANACLNMAKAFRQGLGTSTNLVAAYAWLNVASETVGGSIVARVEMNELALKMDTLSLQQAQNLAAQFKASNWQAPVARALPEGNARLKVNGITSGTKSPLAVINGKTLSEGESATVDVKPGTLKIKCLKIENDSVLISVDGEDQPRLLRMK
jgi:hypothetical protein